jgi:tRNA(Met) C34 N-acetyltransferase TmcA
VPEMLHNRKYKLEIINNCFSLHLLRKWTNANKELHIRSDQQNKYTDINYKKKMNTRLQKACPSEPRTNNTAIIANLTNNIKIVINIVSTLLVTPENMAVI